MRTRMLSALFTLTATAASAGTSPWTATGPAGGAVSALDRSPATLYLGSANRLYRSDDEGAQWQSAFAGSSFSDIAVSRHEPQRILAATGRRILRSVNGGVDWSEIELPAAVSRIVRSLLPEHTAVAMAVAGEQLLRSTDDGISWHAILDGTGQPLAASAVAADPRAANYYAVDRYGRLLASTDGGLSWQHRGTLPPSGMATPDIAVDGTDSRFVYVVIHSIDVSYLYRYRTDTLAFQQVHAAERFGAVIVDPWTAGRLWVSGKNSGPGYDRVFESIDRGETWQSVYAGSPVALLSADAYAPDRLYGQNSLGLVVSDDAGRTWSSRVSGIDSASTAAVSLDPRNPTTLLAALSSGGVRISTDLGAAWESADAGLGEASVKSLTRHPFLADTVYAATDAGLFRSDDGGRQWQAMAGAAGSFSALAIDSTDPARMTALRGGILSSADGGATWQSMFPDAVAIEASAAGGPVYALRQNQGLQRIVMRAPGHGRTFEIVGGDLRLATLAAHPYAASIVIGVRTGTPTSIYLSVDGGLTWQLRGTLEASGVPRIAFDRCDPASVHLASGHSVYHSTDWGATWTPEALPIPSQQHHDLSTACAGGLSYVALGSWNSGVQVRAPTHTERITRGSFEPL